MSEAYLRYGIFVTRYVGVRDLQPHSPNPMTRSADRQRLELAYRPQIALSYVR